MSTGKAVATGGRREEASGCDGGVSCSRSVRQRRKLGQARSMAEMQSTSWFQLEQAVRTSPNGASGNRAVPSPEDVHGAGPANLVAFGPDQRNDAGLPPVDEVWTRGVGSKDRDRLVADALDEGGIKCRDAVLRPRG